ncbi:unnamed protein product [Effrenium voratum]|nr:unnamed protein product [Effrenium voratum]
MATAEVLIAPAQENVDAPSREIGQCRFCLESGGELIAPCLCSGHSKWVHRKCLDRWRADGRGPRSFTHCPTCHFAYLLALQRAPTELQRDLREKRRAVLRQAAGHFFLAAVCIQLFLCLFAVLLRACDPSERLVALLPFSSPIAAQEGKASFLDAFRYHKATYYFASCVLSAAMLGLGILVLWLVSCLSCCRRATTPARELNPHVRRVGDTYWEFCCEPILDDPQHTYLQARCCSDCCRACCRYNGPVGSINHVSLDCCDCSRCMDNAHLGGSSGDDSNNIGGTVIAIILVVILFLAIIGIFFLMLALVTWIQKVASRYVALQELRELTTEYVVQDLSNLMPKAVQENSHGFDVESGSAPPLDWVPRMPQEVRVNLGPDLQAVYGLQSL